MVVKCPAEICVGDCIWTWSAQEWVTVTRVEQRPYDTAMLRLADGQTIEAYSKKLIR
jgi:hypothetical protein